jgi:hypothetical protein
MSSWPTTFESQTDVGPKRKQTEFRRAMRVDALWIEGEP